MLQRDAFKLKASTSRNRLPPLLSEMPLKFSAPPPPRLISFRVSSYFRILKIAQSVGRTGAADSGGARGTGRARGHLRRSSARRCCAPGRRQMEVPPSLPSCSSFSITLSFSSADPPPHGPRKRTAIPRGRKQSLPCVCRSSSW